ncbi:MAG: hypothetical protein M3256_13895 [Actinomycetota bacterium]|nr:hypothetical protein [Actinomycetota bacterium]
MRFRRVLLIVGCGFAAVVSLVLLAKGRGDVAAVDLSLAVLAVAALPLLTSWASPGRLTVERQRELGLDDLVFFSYPDEGAVGGHLPRDVLLQMHVAVMNVGGRTAVLSGLSLEGLLGPGDVSIGTPLLPGLVVAHQYRQWESRLLTRGVFEIHSETSIPPFLVEPDAVMTLRLRWRGGIDWSAAWDIDKLRQAAESLSLPITGARLLLIYRAGPKVFRKTIKVELSVQAQDDYRQRLGLVTNSFSERPQAAPRSIDPYDVGSGVPIAR